jgi:hypothetical protein
MAFQQLQTPADTRQIPAVVCWPGPPSTPFRTPGVFYAGSDGASYAATAAPAHSFKGISPRNVQAQHAQSCKRKIPQKISKIKIIILIEEMLRSSFK